MTSGLDEGVAKCRLGTSTSQAHHPSIRAARSSQFHSHSGQRIHLLPTPSPVAPPSACDKKNGQTKGVFGKTSKLLPDPSSVASPGSSRMSRHPHPCGKCEHKMYRYLEIK